jgi:hypothetical protein
MDQGAAGQPPASSASAGRPVLSSVRPHEPDRPRSPIARPGYTEHNHAAPSWGAFRRSPIPSPV